MRPLLIMAFAAGVSVAGSPSAAQPPPMAYTNKPFPPQTGITPDVSERNRAKVRKRLKQLHNDAVALQKADHGELTPEHRAELEQRLAALRDEACRAGLAGC